MDRLETLIGNENAADTAVSSVGAALDISARFQAVDQPADRNLPAIQLTRKVHLHHTFIASTREPRQTRPFRAGDTQRFHDLVSKGAPTSRQVEVEKSDTRLDKQSVTEGKHV